MVTKNDKALATFTKTKGDMPVYRPTEDIATVVEVK